MKKPLLLFLFVTIFSIAITALVMHEDKENANAKIDHASNVSSSTTNKNTYNNQSYAATTNSNGLTDPLGHPVNFEGRTIREIIDLYANKARAGDAQAAYQVYVAETLCAGETERNESDKRAGKTDSATMRDVVLRSQCSAVSAPEIQERLKFLLIAANGRNPDAMNLYYMEGPNGIPQQIYPDDRDPNIQEWKRNSLQFLQEAANGGNQTSLALLSQAYDNGTIVEKSTEQSLMYAAAYSSAKNQNVENSRLVMMLSRQLPSNDAKAAIQAGVAFANQCCKKEG